MRKADYDIDCEQRKLDGKKPQPLFSIEVMFRDPADPQMMRRWFIANHTWPETIRVRESMVLAGIFLQHSPGRGEVIFPRHIVRCLVDIQPNGWKEIVEGPLT